MNQYEIKKLRGELTRKQEKLKEEIEDHKHTQDSLVQIQAERDRFYSELVVNRQTIEKVEVLMAQKMKEIRTKLEQQNSDSIRELQNLRDKLVEERLLRQRLDQESRNKDTVISELSLRLKQMSRKYKDPSLLVNVKEVADQASVTNNNFYKLTEKYNKICGDMENVMAENKILRKLHGVPENFGFDLEEIKIAEKQELEDYKAQSRRLEVEIEELEEERTQLRYRLRQYNTLFSNKGDRYKDMTGQQLDLLDQYALNLKEGRADLPQIDKTQRQMEREIIKLKGQIQILQNKGVPLPLHQRSNTQSQGNDKLSLEAIRRMQEQLVKLIAPLREDMSRMSDGSGRPQQMASAQMVMQAPQFKPPMPLPIAHNDWSQIKDGFSYMYNSKIPIDLKGIEDDGSFNIIKARYQVAALQLQNMQSLKLLRQKQMVQDRLSKEVSDLKQKFTRCLRVQDKLFLQYFKQKEQGFQKIRKLEIEKNSLGGEVASLEVNLKSVTDSFNALSKKTDVEKRCVDLTSRLAIAEAELLKITRIYGVLNQEHLILKKSYMNLEQKWANTESSLKEKLAYAKKNLKELCFFMNKILEEGKDSVGREVHQTAVNKLQNISDRSMNSAIKETELRLRINQLQNVERELNLKDDVIENLRDDNFDLILEMEIVKSRLEATDGDYRHFQDVFRRLIGFINQNNISIMTYFKKFDRDGSGQLDKNQFISAIRALGFEVSNNEFDLLFNEFDLDGSKVISYRQFLRKMRRSGVFTRNSEQQALFRLFKAIKQANISVRKAFLMIDMDGSNEVSKSQMESAFRKIGIDISSQTVDFIFKMCDQDMSGTISCDQFQRLFDSIIRESMIEEKEVFPSEMDWKLMFVLKMEEMSEKYHQGGLKQTFNSLDTDKSQSLTLNQLSEFFKKADIEVPRKQLLELFQFMDRHRDGKVEYFQFLKILEEARQEKKRVDRMRYIKARTQELRKQSRGDDKDVKISAATEQKSLNIKLLSLESKHTSLLKKNDKLIKSVVNRQQQMNELKREVQELQKNVQNIRTQYYQQKESSIKMQEQLTNRISEVDSKKLTVEQRQLQVALKQSSTDLEVYKNLYEDLSTKNRYEEMRLGKVESELEKYYQIVKDLQGQSDANAELGKRVYELEVSKRNEQITNKNYERNIDEVRALQLQSRQASDQAMEKERQIIQVHMFMQEKTSLLQQNIDQLQSKLLPTLNPHKVSDILARIRQIGQAKTQLQKENRDLRELNFNVQVRNDYLQHQKISVEELQLKLRRTYTDQASLTIMELTHKLSEYRMSELKARRQSGLLKQKEEYYLRVNNANNDNIKDLQTELGNWETKYNQRQEFWRKRLAEQMKVMEDIQKQVTKSKQDERKAQVFFQQEERQQRMVGQKFESLPQEKQLKLTTMMGRRDNGNDNAVFQLKAKIQELQQQLMQKQKQIYQLKSTFKEIVPEAKLTDFAGQMSSSTTNFLMQTELTTSQLRNNARRFISNQKDQETYYKDEAAKINQAAQQCIDTLQRMIDDKNQQLRRKEQLIDQLRREFIKIKEEDTQQIQLLNQEIRELKTKTQVSTVNQLMSKPTSKNFYGGGGRADQMVEMRSLLAKKEQDYKMLLDKYDRLYIGKDKKSQQQSMVSGKVLERKVEDLQVQRDIEKKRYMENQQRLTLKIKNLQKLSKEKDVKLGKLQKTLLDLKNLAVSEAVKGDHDEVEEQLKEALVGLTKGKTANDSKMEMTMQKSLQMVQQLSKKNREYEHQVKRLREQKMGRTQFKK